MNESNPYESPQAASQSVQPKPGGKRKSSVTTVSRLIGVSLMIFAVFMLAVSGIAAIGMFCLGAFLTFGGTVPDLYRPTNKRQMRLQVKQQMAKRNNEPDEEIDPDEYFRQLERE